MSLATINNENEMEEIISMRDALGPSVSVTSFWIGLTDQFSNSADGNDWMWYPQQTWFVLYALVIIICKTYNNHLCLFLVTIAPTISGGTQRILMEFYLEHVFIFQQALLKLHIFSMPNVINPLFHLFVTVKS